MSRADKIEIEGVVSDVLPGTKYKVTLENGHVVDCTLSGKMRINNIRVVNNDKVTIEMSPYDLTKGIIVFRDR